MDETIEEPHDQKGLLGLKDWKEISKTIWVWNWRVKRENKSKELAQKI